MPRVFFHILGFGGKPHDKRSILVIAATPATISGFYHLEDDFITLFLFFIGDLLGAVIGHGGAGDENLLLRGALLHRLLHLQRTGDVHSGDRWRRRQADRPGDQRHLRARAAAARAMAKPILPEL